MYGRRREMLAGKQLKTPSLSRYCFPALRLRAGTPLCERLETANPKLVTADNSRDLEKLIVFNDTLLLWYAFFIFVIVGRVSSVGRALDLQSGRLRVRFPGPDQYSGS